MVAVVGDGACDVAERDAIKVLRLKEGADYTVSINGYDSGAMDYSIGFMDDEGSYSDMRTFPDIPIEASTLIETQASPGDETMMKVDNDGDGVFDEYYRAGAGEEGYLVDNSWIGYLVVMGFVVVFLVSVSAYIAVRLHRKAGR